MDKLLERSDWLYAALAVLVALIPSRGWRGLGGVGLSLALLGVAAGLVEGPAGDPVFVTTNEILIGAGALLVLGAALLGWKAGADRGEPPPARGSGFPDPLLLTGLALAAAAPHLLLLALGIALAAAAALRRTIASGRRGWIIPLGAGVVAIGIGIAMMFTILGEESASLARLAEGPWSPAGEGLLVLLFGLGGFALSGLPPLHRAPWRLTLGPVGAVLLARLIAPALAGGLLHWQAAGMGVAVLSAAWSVRLGRWDLLAVAAGIAALWSGDPEARFAGSALVLTGWLLDRAAARELAPAPALPRRWRGVALLLPALLAPLALAGMLAEQVALPVLLVLVAAAGGLVEFGRRKPSPP